MMKRLLICCFLLFPTLLVWGAETGLFTYEGGFFVKSGNTWKEYRHKDKPGVPPNNAPAISAMIGSFAPQGMNVVVIIVIFLSLSFSIVRDAITPGTPQPVPMSIGMKLARIVTNIVTMRMQSVQNVGKQDIRFMIKHGQM